MESKGNGEGKVRNQREGKRRKAMTAIHMRDRAASWHYETIINIHNWVFLLADLCKRILKYYCNFTQN